MDGSTGALQDAHFKIGPGIYFFFHDKESYALEELSYSGLENKFLRLRMILICILSDLFKFFSFLSKENFQL